MGQCSVILFVGILLTLKADNPQTVINSDLQSGKIFNTYEDAANAWGNTNGPLTGSDGLERGAFIYSTVRHDGNTYYMLSKTFIGKSDNVVGGFVVGYIWSGVRSKFGNELVGFIHTHPHQHGSRDNTSNADDFLVYLPGISRGSVYDTKGVGIQYDRLGSYDPSGNFYPSGSSNFWGALWLMINNGHG